MMKRRSTDPHSRWHRLIERWGPRRARQLLVLATLLYIAMMVAAAALLVSQGLPWERRLRAGLIAILALIALWLWLRVLRTQWARLRVVTEAGGQDAEDTGIWGVGGPGMRTPGTTGLTRILPERRRSQDVEDGGNSA
jgi:protein-S-isoprenylcysteine O-methyltransferase Ste14